MSVGSYAHRNARTTRVTTFGDRRSGKTERIINLAAGCILAHGQPIIAARDASDAYLVRSRLRDRLRELGITNPELTAKLTVRPRTERSLELGRTGPVFYEEYEDEHERLSGARDGRLPAVETWSV